MQTNLQPAGMGHNSQMVDPALLAADHAKVLERVEALSQAAGRVPEDPTAEEAAKLADMKKQITTCEGAVEDARKNAKDPYFRAGQEVDNFFRAPSKVLADAKTKVNAAIKRFIDKEERRKAEERQAEEERLRKEAADKAAAAAVLEQNNMSNQAEAMLEDAIKSESQAGQFAQARAENPNPVKVRGALGSVSYTTRTVGVIIDRNKLDLEALRPYIPLPALQTALNAYVKAGGSQLAGAEIKQEKSIR